MLFNLANQYAANEMFNEALNTYQVIVKNKMFTNAGKHKQRFFYHHMYITIRITIYLHYLLWLMCFPTVYAVQVMTIGEMNYGRMLLDWSFNSSRQSRSGWNHVLLRWFVLFCYCMLLNLMQTCEWKNFKFALFLVTWHLWWFYTCSSYIFMYIYLSIGIWINCTDNC